MRNDDDDRPVKKVRNKNRSDDEEDFDDEATSDAAERRPHREPVKLVAVYPRKRKGEICFLSVEDDDVVVRNEKDEILASFPAAEANQIIGLPSFWKSISQIMIGEELAFDPTPEAVQAVKEFIDDCLHANPEAASAAMRRKGIRDLIIGSVAFLLGIGITVWTFVSAPPGGTFYVMTGLIVVGLFEIIRGIYWMAKAGEF